MNTVFCTSFLARIIRTTAVAALALSPAMSFAQTNTSTGAQALSHLTTGNDNVADGFAALYYNTTGNYNSAVGFEALLYNTVGSRNTAAGYMSLYGNTTGTDNAAAGYSALFLNTTGWGNVANGSQALWHNTVGYANVANGYMAVYSNTNGYDNIGIGDSALYNMTDGNDNVAIGMASQLKALSGTCNIAVGQGTLSTNQTGCWNTAVGFGALQGSLGASNIAMGCLAGFNISGGSNNIDIGNNGVNSDNGVTRIGTAGKQTSAFISGVNGVTASGGVPVYINANGQLGTILSSRRFKTDIHDMGTVSDKLMQLRPVTFRYKDSAEKGPHLKQYGLIAEEVAKVCPDLVQYDRQGKPYTVYYHLLTPMLLNEFQKEHRQAVAQKNEIAALKQTERTEMASLRSELAALKTAQQQQLKALARLTSPEQAARVDSAVFVQH